MGPVMAARLWNDSMARRRQRVAGGEQAFSVIEVMIALFVLLVGFIFMAQLIATSVVVNRSSLRLSSLTQLAAEKVEELRARPLSDQSFDVAGNPDNPNGTLPSVGSIGADQTQTLVDAAGTSHTVSFFDTVTVDQRTGTITRTAGPDDTNQYQSDIRSLSGVTSSSSSSSAPTSVTYRRRWLVEGNQPIAGAIRITVDLSIPAVTGYNQYRQVIRLRAVR
jgi:Tfp pilus assembly protein PilV